MATSALWAESAYHNSILTIPAPEAVMVAVDGLFDDLDALDRLIAALDAIEGDCDLEEIDEREADLCDCEFTVTEWHRRPKFYQCSGKEHSGIKPRALALYAVGSDDDAEDDDSDRCTASDDGCGAAMILGTAGPGSDYVDGLRADFGIDQTLPALPPMAWRTRAQREMVGYRCPMKLRAEAERQARECRA